MEKLILGIALGALGIVLVAVASIFGGTILWLIWPVAIPTAFPGLVSGGVLAASLHWWQAVCLTWAFGLLVRSSSSVPTKK